MTSEFYSIVEDILNNEEFNKLRCIEHHGVTRFDHSLKVSCYSYNIAKKIHFNYKEMARGALLHDFFSSSDKRSSKDKLISVFTHSEEALLNASKEFKLTDREKNIISSHMFPIGMTLPKYKESILITFVDKFVALQEFSIKTKRKFKLVYNLIILVLFTVVK